eukprot:2138965-Amphidinium_carterae.1
MVVPQGRAASPSYGGQGVHSTPVGFGVWGILICVIATSHFEVRRQAHCMDLSTNSAISLNTAWQRKYKPQRKTWQML